MQRSDVLNSLLGLTRGSRYLEIGVQQGITFQAVNVAEKVAVDPQFLFDVEAAKARSGGATYHEMTSDSYFSNHVAAAEKFDLIFIDGLHTFDQTLRDLLNASYTLAEGGVLVIDDVVPSSYAASLPSHAAMGALTRATGDTSPAWMGDVFRLVFFIRDYLPAFSYATILENHGQTVLWRAPRAVPADSRSVEAVARLGYVDSVLEQASFNLMPFAEIVRTIRG